MSVTEGTDVFVNSIADDVWGSEDKVSWVAKLRVGIEHVYKLFQCLLPWLIVEQII